ncbi:MAG TPA: helix-turn-helix transcriptional regulator [Acidimicrobiales bacterium]|nr:helix-turn-helix transcriptional regulator [Acidimicrobiales bacterium]
MTTVVPLWTLADRLRKARENAGLLQKDLADYTGLSRSAIAMYEQARAVPRLGVLRLWAERCGVPLEWLQYGDAPPLPDIVASRKPRKKKGRRPPVTSRYPLPAGRLILGVAA